MAANRGLVIGVVAAVVAAIAGGWFYARTLPQEVGSVAAPVAAPSAAPVAVAEAPVAEVSVPDTPAIVPLAPPALSVVRVTEDGGALVSGTGQSGAAITVRVDGVAVAEAATDGAGQFVSMFDLGFSEAAQVLTLELVTAMGEVVLGSDSTILVPRPAPVVAQVLAEPDTADETLDPAVEIEAPEGGELVATQVAALAPLVPAADAPAEVADSGAEAEVEVVADAEVVAEVATTAPVLEQQAPEQTAELAETGTPQNFILRESGAVVVLNAAPQALQSVVVDAISYDAVGDLVISGRARPDQGASRVQLYLDNRPVALAATSNGGWAADLPQVDPGVYSLRVDEIDAGGQVISRFETPFQREEPQVVASAQARANAAGGDGAETPRAALITVQPGHTLWQISAAHYGEGIRYVQVFNANRTQIRNPDLIFPGQVFVLPED